MTTIRDSLWLVIGDGNRVRTILSKPPTITGPTSGRSRTVVRVPHAAVTAALRLAEGDVGRLVLGTDGTVTVANASRQRPRAAREFGAPW